MINIVRFNIAIILFVVAVFFIGCQREIAQNMTQKSSSGAISLTEKERWKTFTLADGLTNETPTSGFFEDREGNIWVGTKDGANRFNGKNWELFKIPNGFTIGDEVKSITQDKTSKIWFLTDGGMTSFDGTTSKSFTSESYLSSLRNDDNGNLWALTWDKGIIFYDGQSWHPFTTREGLASNSVLSIIQGMDGNYWAMHADIGIFSQYDGNLWSVVTFDGVTANVSSVDVKGRLWVTTQTEHKYYDGKNWYSVQPHEEIYHYSDAIFQDNRGNLWSWGDNSIWYWDGHSTHKFTTDDGLSVGSVVRIIQDKQGNIWLNSFVNNNLIITYYDWNRFTIVHSLEFIRYLYCDIKGNLWFGTDNSIIRYNPG